jgi:tetratricopeptide (TPR) repeat protein
MTPRLFFRDQARAELLTAQFALMEAGPALRRGDWQSVVEVVRPWASRVKEPGYGFYAGDTYLTWWVLAHAYAQIGQPDSAIVHLESIVGPPRYQVDNVSWYGLPYSAAHFKLGQLYAQVGDTTQAIQHYARFLDVFTDPDPEYVWMVEEARAAVERLARER